MHADASSSFIATAAAAAEVPIYYWIMMSHAEPAVIRPPFNIYIWVLESQQESLKIITTTNPRESRQVK